MTLTRKRYKPRKPWLCPRCGHRNEHRTSSRKCQGCNENTKPKRRVPPHARTLRDDSYETYELLSATIHGGEPGNCGVCGRPPKANRNNDRDHDHRRDSPSYGRPRGLACPRCNTELLRNTTLEEARAVVAYLERVERYYAGWR